VQALKRRIIELEDALAETEGERPAKRARKSDPVGLGLGTASAKAEEKKKKAQIKKIFDRLKKECKSDGVKFQHQCLTIKFDEVMTAEEFDAIFGGKGTLVQPRPDNKPTSTVTIIQFNNQEQIQELFGDELKPLKGNKWSVGGQPIRVGSGGGRSFSKSQKIGPCDVEIRSLETTFSKNGLKCTLKFDIAQSDGDGRYGGYDSYY